MVQLPRFCELTLVDVRWKIRPCTLHSTVRSLTLLHTGVSSPFILTDDNLISVFPRVGRLVLEGFPPWGLLSALKRSGTLPALTTLSLRRGRNSNDGQLDLGKIRKWVECRRALGYALTTLELDSSDNLDAFWIMLVYDLSISFSNVYIVEASSCQSS